MDLLLGLDVGTTATKALLFDLGGRVVASATHAYGLITPRQGWVEQDPEDLWRGVVTTCRAVVGQVDPDDNTTYIGFQFGFYFSLDPGGKRATVRP